MCAVSLACFGVDRFGVHIYNPGQLTDARTAANPSLRIGEKKDEYFLVEFSDSPHLVTGLTTDITKLQNRLLLTRAKGMTSLYDAM